MMDSNVQFEQTEEERSGTPYGLDKDLFNIHTESVFRAVEEEGGRRGGR